MPLTEEQKRQQYERIKQIMLEHRQKLETDEEYRKEYERISDLADKYLIHFGNDTE